MNQSIADRTAAEEAEERRLNAARDSFPGWRIIEVFGGYLAVPAGTPIVQAISLDGLVMKLREHGELKQVSESAVPFTPRRLALASDIVTDWTVIVGSVTTLLGGLGGYWLAGRNDENRDKRAAARESAARRDSFAERLEEDRHTFQRDTLLELQDELQRLARNTAQILLRDRQTIKAEGQVYLLGGDLSDEDMRLRVSVSRLRSRVLDDQLRAEVGELVDLCAASGMGQSRSFKRGWFRLTTPTAG